MTIRTFVICCLSGLLYPGINDACAETEEGEPASDQTPLPLKYPLPSFVGTPLAYQSERLEPSSLKMRKPFLAPKDAVNAALEKPVTASDIPWLGELSQIVDGKKQHDQTFQVELPNEPQWIQIDLGAPHEVHAIVVWHYHATERVYFDFVVRTALDETLSEEVTTHYNNDHDNSSGLGVGKDKEYVESFQGRLVDAKGALARYVRLSSNGNTGNGHNHYIEVEVWASPVDK
ncbi:MAG: hypothetical protein P8L49_09870 [Opitutaceae bacterium]|nr:hypothetical protein [Opitutaceae bacterium]